MKVAERKTKEPKIKIKTVRVGDLIRDDDLWPRCLTQLDDVNLGRIRGAIRAGEKLPPPRCDAKSLAIVDGNHRITAYRGMFGDDHKIEVEVLDYASKKDMLVDAAALNSRHGMPLDTKDRIRTILRLRELKASREEICKAMAMTPVQFEKYMKRTATGSNGKTVALPRGAAGLANTRLTKEQEQQIPKIGGVVVASQARMLIAQIKAGVVDLNNKNEVAILTELKGLLASIL